MGSVTGGRSRFSPDSLLRKAATLLVALLGAAGGPARVGDERSVMELEGLFQTDRATYRLGEPIGVTLVLRNAGPRLLYVFVPRGRAEGVEVTVLEGPAAIRDMDQEPEPGLVGETRIDPGESYRQPYVLSNWLEVQQPGALRIACRVVLTVRATSLRHAISPRAVKAVEIASAIDFFVLPSGQSGQP